MTTVLPDWRQYLPAPDLLAGRTVLITGAGNGIGRACAIGCARLGAEVILLGRTVRRLEATYDAIEQAGGRRPALYPLNLQGASPADYVVLAETLAADLGRLDGLVHCAADPGEPSPLRYLDPMAWTLRLHTSLTAPYLLTQACLPLLLASEDAAVLFTVNGAADGPQAYTGAWGVAQSAIIGLVRLLARELTSYDHIRIDAIVPGPTRTRLRARAFPAEDASTLAAPELWLPAYFYLLGPLGRRISGEVWRLDAQSDGDGAQR